MISEADTAWLHLGNKNDTKNQLVSNKKMYIINTLSFSCRLLNLNSCLFIIPPGGFPKLTHLRTYAFAHFLYLNHYLLVLFQHLTFSLNLHYAAALEPDQIHEGKLYK